MKIPNPNPRRRARIEIIPLIDIVFFLLATFVMVSLSMVKTQGINVNFPAASSAAPQERKAAATLTVTEGGDFYFNKDKIEQEELSARLSVLKQNDPDPTVIINADEKAIFGNTVFVLDEVRKMNIRKVAIQTKKKENI